jgi:SAM-dependent methyltransferase
VSAGSLASWFASSEYFGAKGGRGSAYADYLADEANRFSEARERVARDLRPIFPAGARLLEVGCATGSLLAALREKGYVVTGVDVSEPLARHARAAYGLDVRVGLFEEVPLPDASYDGVLMFGTICNFPRFHETLDRVCKLLSAGGLLVFNIPVADAWIVRYLYRSSFWMFAPSANFFATEAGCRRALARAGLCVETMRRDLQRPSLRKLLHHGKVDRVLSLLERLGLGGAALPGAIPAPAVRFVVARRGAVRA